LAALVGPEAKGLSASTITRLKEVWQGEFQEWSQRSLKGNDYVYVWADGVHCEGPGLVDTGGGEIMSL